MWQNHPKLLAKWTQKGEYGANHGLRTVTLGGVRGCELNANNVIFDTQHNHHLHITVSHLKLLAHTRTHAQTHTHTLCKFICRYICKHICWYICKYISIFPFFWSICTVPFTAQQIVLTRVLLSFWIPPPGDAFGNYIAEYFVFCFGCISILSMLYLII